MAWFGITWFLVFYNQITNRKNAGFSAMLLVNVHRSLTNIANTVNKWLTLLVILFPQSHTEFEQYASLREKCVQCIKVPHIYFGTQPDTFATAVAILDVFLWKVKVRAPTTSLLHLSTPVQRHPIYNNAPSLPPRFINSLLRV